MATIRTYGGWTVPRSEGLLGMSTGMTIALFPWLLGMIILPQISWGLAGLWLVVGLLVALGMMLKIEGRTLVEWIGLIVGFQKKKKKGLTKYSSGPFSRRAGGHYELPGVLSRFEVHAAQTSGAQEFAMLHYPDMDEYTVIFRVWPQGLGGVDIDTVNGWVDQWGAVLTGWGDDNDIVAATAVVETFRSSGMKVRNEVARITSADAPRLAQEIMVEAAELQSRQSIDMEARVAITIKADTEAKKRDWEIAATDLGRRVPQMMRGLRECGMEAQAMQEEEIVTFVKRAYSSSSQVDMELAAAEAGGHGVSWLDAGPESAEENLTSYVHDGAVSSTWEMKAPPRGYVPHTVLNALMRKNEDCAVKRVAVCYRPHGGAEAAKLVDQDANNKAEAVKQQRQRKKFASAKSEQDAVAANDARYAEAMGHGLVRFGILVTITEPAPALTPAGELTESKLPNAEAVMKSLSQRARLQIRNRYASQQISFAASLGVGVSIPEHVTGAAKAQSQA